MTHKAYPLGKPTPFSEPELWRIPVKQLLIAILLILSSSLAAQYYSLRIVDSTGQPIENVKVSHGKANYFSDAAGLVNLRFGGDLLVFNRLGFEELQLRGDQIPPDMVVVLETRAIQHPLIRVTELEYRSSTPALDVHLIHPDTNARALGSADMLLGSSSFGSSDNKLLGERQTLSLLGSLNRHTLVMLDGIALNSAGEAFDFSKIPLSQIERIEIIKGNSSAYGGSAAIGGIVNIITKAPKRLDQAEFGISGGFGSYDMFGQEYQISVMQKGLSLFAQYRHYHATNDFGYTAWWDPDTNYKRKHNAKTTDNVYLKSAYSILQQSLEYSLSQGSFVRQLPGPINFPDLYDDSHMSGSNEYHSLKHNWQNKALANEITAFHHSDFSAYRNLQPSNPVNPNKYSQRQQNFGLRNSFSLISGESSLDALAEVKRLSYKFIQYNLYQDSSSILRGEQDNLAVALRAGQKYAFSFLDGRSQLSLRGDFGDKDSNFTWRAEQEISYQSSIKYSLGGTLGTAFSIPSLYDMYWIGDSETLGNPNLESEHSRAYSLRGGLEHERWQFKAAFYNNEIDNLIQWRQIFMFGSRWQPFNVGTAQIRNLELEGNWRVLRPLSLFGGVTFTEAKDFSLKSDGSHSATWGKYLTYTPDLKVSLSLKLADDMRACSVSWNYTGRQYSTIDNAIDPLPGFDSLDLSLMHKFKILGLDVVADSGLKNITNNSYEVYAYTPQPGFNWSCGLSLSYMLR